MMRDAFIQSLEAGRMDLDYLAYEPAVIYVNGVYYGIENLRERSNTDYVWSNYGLGDEEVTLIEATYKDVDTDKDIATDAGFAALSSFLKSFDLKDPAIYARLRDMIDVDEFINYLIPEIYMANTDWPYNNVKMWKRTYSGRWRWMLVDTDFGFEWGRVAHNTLTFALGENSDGIIGGYSVQPEWSVIVFNRLITNTTFLNAFIDRFAIHLATTYNPTRINAVMDSLANRIQPEMSYHKARWGLADNFTSILTSMKAFAANRQDYMLQFISQRFLATGTHRLNISRTCQELPTH